MFTLPCGTTGRCEAQTEDNILHHRRVARACWRQPGAVKELQEVGRDAFLKKKIIRRLHGKGLFSNSSFLIPKDATRDRPIALLYDDSMAAKAGSAIVGGPESEHQYDSDAATCAAGGVVWVVWDWSANFHVAAIHSQVWAMCCSRQILFFSRFCAVLNAHGNSARK